MRSSGIFGFRCLNVHMHVRVCVRVCAHSWRRRGSSVAVFKDAPSLRSHHLQPDLELLEAIGGGGGLTAVRSHKKFAV